MFIFTNANMYVNLSKNTLSTVNYPSTISVEVSENMAIDGITKSIVHIVHSWTSLELFREEALYDGFAREERVHLHSIYSQTKKKI